MFASFESRAETNWSRLETSTPHRSTFATQLSRSHRPESDPAEATLPSGQSWNFSKIPISRPDGAARQGVTDTTILEDQTVVRDQSGSGSGSGSGSAAPAAPAGPTVDRIDLVNTSTGAISGYPAITSGDLNSPGPFNSASVVSHVLQVHFHLDHGNSTALTPRREIQRTSTHGSTTSKNPPDRPATGGGTPTPGGFAGTLVGPDGPGSHEIKRPATDKIVVADAPGLASLSASDFPVTYKAHFTVTVAAGSTDIARINYDVLIDKRTATEVPNTENRSVSTGKQDLVRGKAL